MKFIARLLIIIVGFVYYPLNLIYLKVQKWYLPMWEKDKVVFIAFAPFYWALVIVVTVISFPLDILAKIAH